ncbi:hypothetical protein FQR65_LT10286 [Abscondita terminalis]|nr:hypothetical protein FQR65_LT10286 [Abscondita terminalis]
MPFGLHRIENCYKHRFGKYGQYSGSQYLVSLRQILESEKKIRMQSLTPILLKGQNLHLQISVEDVLKCNSQGPNEDEEQPITNDALFVAAFVDENDLDLIEDSTWPLLTFIGGYTSYMVKKRLVCGYCNDFVVNDELSGVKYDSTLIAESDRGGLCYPVEDVVKICAFAFKTVKKLVVNENLFLAEKNTLNITL